MKRVGPVLGLMILPAALVVVAHLGGDPAQLGVEPSVAAVAFSDPKISRTAKHFSLDDLSQMDATRLVPIDRPGMTFRFKMPAALQHRFWMARGPDKLEKIGAVDVRLAIEDGPSFICLAQARGHATSNKARKSFLVDLLSSQRFTADIECRKLFLLNLSFDPHGFKHRFSYLLLGELGLFPSYNQFAVVSINGQPQGLYLVVERPEDAIKRTKDDVVSVLRMYRTETEVKHASSRSEYKKTLKALEKANKIQDPVAQAKALDALIDLDAYMTWLAFNSLVQNADSVDEVFFYETRRRGKARGRFGVAAWDYDDLQRPPSHPRYVHEDQLLWATERRLDLAIIENGVLYARYKRILNKLLAEHLTPTHLLSTLERVKSDLNSLDTELPSDQQATLMAEREVAVGEFEKRLLERRNFLLEKCAQTMSGE